MNKLEIITKAFKGNQDIVVFGPHEKKSFGEDYDGGIVHDAHTLHYVVAPKVGIYSISKLNKWFTDLIPHYQSLHPENDEKFRLDGDKEIRIGHLRFDETGLGHIETLITRIERVTDEDLLRNAKGFKDGMRVRTEQMKANLGRMIMIYGCPNTITAKNVYEAYKNGSFMSSVPVEKIDK